MVILFFFLFYIYIYICTFDESLCLCCFKHLYLIIISGAKDAHKII